MEREFNISNILKNNISNPSFLLDESGKIIDLNDGARNYIPNFSVDWFIFDRFGDENLQKVEKLFLRAKRFGKPVNDTIVLNPENSKSEESLIIISPFKIDDKLNFLFSINLSNKKASVGEKDNSYNINFVEAKKIISNPKIIEILDDIINSYPFTFIGKSKIQQKADLLGDSIWIKDHNSEFVFVNDKFSRMFGIDITKIEGRQAEQIMPDYLANTFNTVDTLIRKTPSSIQLENFNKFPFITDKGSLNIIKIPILSLDGKVKGIIGLTQTSVKPTLHPSSDLINNIFENVNKPLIVTNNKLDVQIINSAAKDLLNVKEDSGELNLKNFLNDVFYIDLLNFISNKEETAEKIYKYELVDKKLNENIQLDVTVNKVFNDEASKLYVTFVFHDFNSTFVSNNKNEDKYELLLSSNNEAVFIYDIENLKFLDVNKKALNLYGYNREKFLSMDLTDLYAPEDIQTLIESTGSEIQEGEIEGPIRQKHQSGSAILVEFTKMNLNYKGRSAQLCVLDNVEDKLEADKKIQSFKSVFDNTSDLILLTDKDGFITFVNDAAIKSLGYSKFDIVKKPILSLVSDKERAVINRTIYHSGIKKQQKISTEVKKADGSLINVEIFANPILDYKNEIDFYNLLIKLDEQTNITAINKISSLEENETQPVKQESSSESIDPSYLSGIFHELLTPINVITGFVQELTESIEKPTEEQLESSQIIRENQKILLKIMDDAVEYSELIKNKPAGLKSETIILSELINDMNASFKQVSELKDFNIVYGNILNSLQFKSDKKKFIFLVTQLLKFAVKNTNEKRIYISAYLKDENHFVFSIKDNPLNITSALYESLSALFTSEANEMRKNYNLSTFTVKLGRRLLEIMEGTTESIYRFENVSEFGFVFPLELKVDENASVDIDLSHVPETISEVKTEVPSIQRVVTTSVPEIKSENKVAPPIVKEHTIHKVLEQETIAVAEVNKIVTNDLSKLSCLYFEDQIDSQILFQSQLKDFKELDFAVSFETAFPLLQQKQFDIIFMDMNLQGEYNGLDALRVIRRMPKYKDTPIIAVTAYVLPGDREKFLTAGFNEFISKPLLKDKVITSLNKVLS